MSARTTRTRLLAASTIALAAFALTACGNGDGVRDEGPSAGARSSARPSEGTAGGTTAKPAGTRTTTGSTSGSKNSGTTTGSKGTGGTGSTGGSAGGKGGTRNPACVAATTRTTATVVSRPLNHLLLTVTNKSSKNCDLTGYPIVRFSEAQSVPPVAEETHPQAVVTLAPGESGYAGVLLSAADGSGVHGYTAKTLEVHYGDQGRNGSARPALPPKGVYIDEKLTVTYWQQDLDTALSY
ncbi:hypothetical protein B0675_11275 [Streptomyces sp. M41(2017)]|uniref:DUF4232 domain-containing protein n=1 Tax=Streptomyces sp. M41(2017) TaxID=1955065 RepID=UPI0009BFC9E1|nr:DUF4232 domain-containing protein [Streptomyces sp. M41(2017)]OQQ17618.1 hypothetical protein B0675_11275 [Streptomyces sp. M41(2017)]